MWELHAGYIRFRDFLLGLTIVNDPAERGVGLIKQFISSFQNEESCYANLLAVSDYRKRVKTVFAGLVVTIPLIVGDQPQGGCVNTLGIVGDHRSSAHWASTWT